MAGNPSVTSITDPAGTITTTVDLLGRTISYIDVWGVTTTTGHDQAGRVTQTSGPLGAVGYGYDAAGRVETQTLDGQLLADPAYHATTKELASTSYPNGTGTAGNGTALATIGRDPAGRTIRLTWTLAGGTTVDDQVTRSQSGKIIDHTVDGVDPYAGSNFEYDAAGRLTRARVPGHDLQYQFEATGGCGILATAGANTNRTAVIDNGGPPVTYCYDNADRLTSLSPAESYANITYDTHGNTTRLGDQVHGYDSADRHMATTNATTTIGYQRDATDRIVARLISGVVEARYGYTGPGDTPDLTYNASGALQERAIGLPGGASVTKRSAGDVWSYPNIHGDTIATANPAGTKTGGTYHYDPYGNPLTGLPDNSAGALDYGWLGQHQRPLEHQTGFIPVIEMGARQYDPVLGRFLEIDPIEGGSSNDFDYAAGDPTNQFDLDGERCSRRNNRRTRVFRDRDAAGHYIKLGCGTRGAHGYGLRHIRSQNHISQAGVSEDQFIALTQQALRGYRRTRQRTGTYLYRGTVALAFPNQGTEDQFTWSVVVSARGEVVTAYARSRCTATIGSLAAGRRCT
ncbi:MAG: RHS repeat-associated core domain-containing protein [Acidimicrobiales bacterium]